MELRGNVILREKTSEEHLQKLHVWMESVGWQQMPNDPAQSFILQFAMSGVSEDADLDAMTKAICGVIQPYLGPRTRFLIIVGNDTFTC